MRYIFRPSRRVSGVLLVLVAAFVLASWILGIEIHTSEPKRSPASFYKASITSGKLFVSFVSRYPQGQGFYGTVAECRSWRAKFAPSTSSRFAGFYWGAYHELRAGDVTDGSLPYRDVGVEQYVGLHPTVILASLLVPAIWLVNPSRRRLNGQSCRGCGYDLRASPNRCPECGRSPGKPGGWQR
jgi:hypothetical protein